MRKATRFAVALAALVVAAGCSAPETERVEPPAEVSGPVNDTTIVTTIQSKYFSSPAVKGRNINVDSSSGVVTLRGTVDTESAKQEAVSIAKATPGVSRVEDQLTMATDSERAMARSGQPDAQSPGWITTKIQAQFYTHPRLKPWNIDVDTAPGGVVTLTGIVDNAADHSEAVTIARGTEGVTSITDRLRVKGEAPATTATTEQASVGLTDGWITAKIQSRYFLDDEVKGRNIDVDTKSGVVTLKGSVNSYSERLQAASIARNTEGVREVRDQLTLEVAAGQSDRTNGETARDAGDVRESVGTAGQKIEDAWITTKIQSKYFMDDQIKGRNVNVDTSNGVVTLKGTLATEAARKAAEALASETDGVTRVVNELAVDSGPA